MEFFMGEKVKFPSVYLLIRVAACIKLLPILLRSMLIEILL